MNIESDTALSIELPCYRCGYDLRAHPSNGICPECAASVATSREWAANPRRPAWKDSDPRWRRRMLAGVWVLAMVPLLDALDKLGWDAQLPAPNFFDSSPMTLIDTYLFTSSVYPSVIFCVGIVLLFAKERGRRSSRLDWTRRWGILCSYIVALLTAAIELFLPALVLLGISALCISMPLKNQPRVTRLFIEVSTRYLRYGPYPKAITFCVLVAFSSIAILLACVPLAEALRSIGLKRMAIILVAPLAAFSLMNIAQAVLHAVGFSPSITDAAFYLLGPYFRPMLLLWNTRGRTWGLFTGPADIRLIVVEFIKWCIPLTIAILLSLAQLAARRKSPQSK